MALPKDRLNKIIQGFVSVLRQEIPVDNVILFGSYAQGTAKDHSDIDLAIISNWFRNRPRIENMQFLSRLAAKYNSLIEALPFTTDEYNNLDKRTFLANVVKTGKEFPLL
ncbi:MAG: nucleotidyltransferase domain-containing protein [bacterium]